MTELQKLGALRTLWNTRVRQGWKEKIVDLHAQKLDLPVASLHSTFPSDSVPSSLFYRGVCASENKKEVPYG